MKAKDWIVVIKFKFNNWPSVIIDADTLEEACDIVKTYNVYAIKSIKIKPSIKE
jgi:hypothetical protein